LGPDDTSVDRGIEISRDCDAPFRILSGRRGFGNCDLAGYGTACKFASEHMGSFDKTGREIATQFRISVANLFYGFLAKIGLSQIHMAGDGLICGFPKRLFPECNPGKALQVFVASYRTFLGEVERLNSYISDQASRVGSRIAIHYGSYRFGRVAQARSFASDFDGASIIEVARLEAALRIFLKGPVQLTTPVDEQNTSAVPVTPYPWAGRHAMACTAETLKEAQTFFQDTDLVEKRGDFEIKVKESASRAAVFELLVEPAQARK
jgi:hypothetical protein